MAAQDVAARLVNQSLLGPTHPIRADLPAREQLRTLLAREPLSSIVDALMPSQVLQTSAGLLVVIGCPCYWEIPT